MPASFVLLSLSLRIAQLARMQAQGGLVGGCGAHLYILFIVAVPLYVCVGTSRCLHIFSSGQKCPHYRAQ